MERDLSEGVREGVGMLLVIGFYYRAAVHVIVAAASDLDPELGDDCDVRLVSPVPSLRNDSTGHIARLICAAVAIIIAFPYGYVASSEFVGVWLTANWLVLVCDPLTGVALWTWQLRERFAYGAA